MNADKTMAQEQEVTKEILSCINRLSGNKKVKLLSILKEWVAKYPREFQRASCLEPVYYCTEDRLYKDFFNNISAGGLFIETREPFTVNQQISLAFSFPGTQHPFKITGTVVRIASEGIGIKFNTESQVQTEMLKNQVNEITI